MLADAVPEHVRLSTGAGVIAIYQVSYGRAASGRVRW